MQTVTLIIDKRRELSVKYKKLLETEQSTVIISKNIISALKTIQDTEPDLILISDSIDSDISDYCRKIRALTYNMRPVIVALSKSADANDRIKALENGADDFISEPVNSDEFLIYGKATQHMPLIVELVSMVEEEIPEPAQADTYAEEQSSRAESVEPAEDSFSEESNSYSYETLIEDTAVQDDEAANQVDEETSEKAADEIPSSDSDEQFSNDTQTQASEALETSESEIPDEQNDKTGESEEEEVESEEDIEDSDEEEEYEEEIEEVDSQNSVDEVDTVLDAEDDEQEDETEPEEVSETPQDESDEVDTETLTNIIDEEIQAEALNPADSEEIIDGEFKEIDDNIEHLESSIEESSLDMPENDSNMELPPIEGVDETELPDNAGSQDEDTNALDDRVSKDVDELIYSSEKQEIPSIDDIVENENSEDSLTEEDLNFIQDVNSPTTEDSLPVYPAETPEGEGKDELALAAGDHVSHPKYGEGVIEKIIRYGNKALCSISFINVGRRLLDPAISEITKLD